MSAGVPVGRFYAVIVIVAVLVGIATFFLGKKEEEAQIAKDAMQQQEMINEVQSEIISRFVSSDDRFDILLKYAD